MEGKFDNDCRENSHGRMRHLLPFLVIPVAFGIMHGVAHRKFARMSMHRGEWKNGVPPMFAEFHRRAHAAEAEKPIEEA